MAKLPRKSKALLGIGQTWRDFYATEHGKAALADLFTWANIYTPIDATDPIEMARQVGERNAALRIIALMGARPTDFIQNAQSDTSLLDHLMSGQPYMT